MTTQPEALRLADELEMWTLGEPAAAELRRLYAERTAADGVVNDLAAKVRGLQTQRDALLDALRRHVELHDGDCICEDCAAIKAVEENT